MITLTFRVLEFLRGVLGLTSPFVKFPVVRADDDDDEEELVDPFVPIRENCKKREKAIALRKKYDECNARVRSKKKTAETCEEELHDLVKVLDHCVAESLFDHVK
ncbi:hypothetical protein V9T40_011660 [Parthenolecanium corni]|uniref:Ubiquinol-cytochrome C reductase hinge domain-containing protein n=1 Tax=Parthenolecanium corni TaxID=536013 RepID=A0AAN9XYS4_9HEMI